jgi:hypothetical protein
MSWNGNECRKTIATIPNTDFDRPKTTGACEIFQLFGKHDYRGRKMEREIKSSIAMAKAALSK